ncbi:potassium transporter peripheral membrane component [Neisseria sp. oral taxon 014 str. F0314]|uniref:Trk system potassium transporter TrkA n=1 Tax=Neisseria sp. oral taxon 014 TaxID=641148 RepID=UPI0001D8C16D|nr:Trk system potassium transporter TrkA [Neisseria sp. oral taxon 014]EFI24656.1 potassium transporter peripheral membrane component [Neisseria sp. oral taxon 014 str. F0314]RKV63162.1 MAG: Trk system potassium transporter TrkA [Neisseria sp.]
MKILIIGSGQVGSTVAQNLASSSANDVTIVDLDEKALHRIGSRLDVQTIVGNGASPFVLEQAGAADSDLLLALTRSDETNIVACKIAADLFNIPSRIARVRSAEYLEYLHPSADGGEEADSLSIFDITETISPEQLVTEQLVGLLSYTSALQVLRFSDDRARMVVVQARQGGLLVNKEIAQINEHLPEGADCQICAVYRNNRLIVPSSKTVIIEGDEVFFVASTDSINAIMRELRPNEQHTRRIMIAGGGKIGHRLAKQLENEYDIKIIEYSSSRAEWLAENLDNTLVLQGTATDETLLDEEYIDEIDVFCALTNDDENNIMSSLLAKNRGAKRVITIVNRSSYVDLLEGNKIDIVVSPHLITIGSILAHIRRGDISAVYPLRRGTAEAIEVVVHGDKKTSSIVGRKISDVKWPQGCHFAALVRGDEVIMAHRGGTVLQDGDHIIFFVSRRRVLRELEKLIQVKMGFFG